MLAEPLVVPLSDRAPRVPRRSHLAVYRSILPSLCPPYPPVPACPMPRSAHFAPYHLLPFRSLTHPLHLTRACLTTHRALAHSLSSCALLFVHLLVAHARVSSITLCTNSLTHLRVMHAAAFPALPRPLSLPLPLPPPAAVRCSRIFFTSTCSISPPSFALNSHLSPFPFHLPTFRPHLTITLFTSRATSTCALALPSLRCAAATHYPLSPRESSGIVRAALPRSFSPARPHPHRFTFQHLPSCYLASHPFYHQLHATH